MKLKTQCTIAVICLVLAYTAIISVAWDTVTLDVPQGANEATWRDALAEKWDGVVEQPVKFGRIDVETGSQVIELDWAVKHAECLGQALFYADAKAGKQGVMALIYPKGLSAKEKAKLCHIEKLANKYGIKVIVLKKGEE